MQDRQHVDVLGRHPVRHDIGKAGNHQLARPGYPSRPADAGMIGELGGRLTEALHDGSSGDRAIPGNVGAGFG